MQIDREVLEEVEAALDPFALCVSEGVVSPENTEPSGHVRVVVVAEYFHRAHTTLARLRKAMETEAVTALTEAEMREQGKKCGCKGTDEYCPCQNVIFRKTAHAALKGTE